MSTSSSVRTATLGSTVSASLTSSTSPAAQAEDSKPQVSAPNAHTGTGDPVAGSGGSEGAGKRQTRVAGPLTQRDMRRRVRRLTRRLGLGLQRVTHEGGPRELRPRGVGRLLQPDARVAHVHQTQPPHLRNPPRTRTSVPSCSPSQRSAQRVRRARPRPNAAECGEATKDLTSSMSCSLSCSV